MRRHMALVLRFIGIDRYVDTSIPDLTGAARDAKALWALFIDTLTAADARLIVDHDATHQVVRRCIDDALTNATADDTIILMFAGHGTRDHRLVLHDSTSTALHSTTIAMSEIADLFKRSRARAILCILDCCFSGAAPARVLESSPLSRATVSPLSDLVGTGRMLLAASLLDEPAYEHPQHRHGLLTYALLQVLQRGSDALSVTAAFDEVLQIVRAEASALGMVQTPVLLGLIEGGLTIPVLRKGANFYDAFPESRAEQVATRMV
jgi:helicase